MPSDNTSIIAPPTDDDYEDDFWWPEYLTKPPRRLRSEYVKKMEDHRKTLMSSVDAAIASGKQAQKDRASGQTSLFGDLNASD